MQTIRTYQPNDLAGITAVANAADTADRTEDGASMEEMQEWFGRPGMAPEENTFVVEENGNLVAFASLQLGADETESSFRTWFLVHPVRRGRALEAHLLDLLYRRAEERLGECKTQRVGFFGHANINERERTAAMERFGMTPVRESWLMVHPALDGIPEPHYPEGISTRAYRMGDDDTAMYRADGEVFRDHWGHTEMPFEAWQHYVAKASFRPDLTLLAEDRTTGEIAGFCTIAINAPENKRLGVRRGWIDILGTRRPYRRHGLGTALLLAGMRNLREAGMEQAALGCDAENITGATRIYKRAGFQVDQVRKIFKKSMRG